MKKLGVVFFVLIGLKMNAQDNYIGISGFGTEEYYFNVDLNYTKNIYQKQYLDFSFGFNRRYNDFNAYKLPINLLFFDSNYLFEVWKSYYERQTIKVGSGIRVGFLTYNSGSYEVGGSGLNISQAKELESFIYGFNVNAVYLYNFTRDFQLLAELKPSYVLGSDFLDFNLDLGIGVAVSF